jgi:hypothetical protein
MLPYLTLGFIVNETGYVRTTQQPIQEFGRVKDCDCRIIPCCCRQNPKSHHENCAFRRALLCAFGFACEQHELLPCPVCDRCDCALWYEADERAAQRADGVSR